MYEAAKVKEYWIIDIQNELVEDFLDKTHKYGKRLYFAKNDQLTSLLFNKLTIDVSELFS